MIAVPKAKHNPGAFGATMSRALRHLHSTPCIPYQMCVAANDGSSVEHAYQPTTCHTACRLVCSCMLVQIAQRRGTSTMLTGIL